MTVILHALCLLTLGFWAFCLLSPFAAMFIAAEQAPRRKPLSASAPQLSLVSRAVWAAIWLAGACGNTWWAQ